MLCAIAAIRLVSTRLVSLQRTSARKTLTIRAATRLKSRMPRKPLDLSATRLFGNPLSIRITTPTEAKRVSVRQTNHQIEIRGPKSSLGTEGVRQVLVQWLRMQAKKDFLQRIEYWSERMGVQVNQVRLKDQRTRWGSCSSLGNINLNWRLIQAPSRIIDYVIIHELAHLVELNHAPAFWAIVSNWYGDHEPAKQWLKIHGAQLYQL